MQTLLCNFHSWFHRYQYIINIVKMLQVVAIVANQGIVVILEILDKLRLVKKAQNRNHYTEVLNNLKDPKKNKFQNTQKVQYCMMVLKGYDKVSLMLPIINFHQ